jgi:CDP-diacylglycerol---serine O-phosphatidyltransferase
MNPTDDDQQQSTAQAEPAPPKKKRHQKLFAVLPTLLTLGNAACGFGAITFAAKVGPTAAYGNELWIAAILIYVAMIFDMFDGAAARWTNQTSEFGAQLDSLCDGISFGVAPAFLMLQFTRGTHESEASLNIESLFTYSPRFLWVAAVMMVLCALLRLARFNVETEDDDSHEFFSGLPSPAAAGVVASFPILMDGLRELAINQESVGRPLAESLIPIVKLVIPLVTLGVAYLMVSRIRFPHFFNQLFSGGRSRTHLLQILFALVLMAFIHQAVLFLIFTYFAFFAPLKHLWVEKIAPRFKKQTLDENNTTTDV